MIPVLGVIVGRFPFLNFFPVSEIFCENQKTGLLEKTRKTLKLETRETSTEHRNNTNPQVSGPCFLRPYFRVP